MIAVEECDDVPRVAIVTCVGIRIGVGVTDQGNQMEQWVRKSNITTLEIWFVQGEEHI